MRSTKAIIHTKDLIHNYNLVKDKNSKTRVCAAVKADAYGHGALEISRILEKLGCDYFGVATVFEAVELLKGQIETPIILLSLGTPDEVENIVKYGIEPVVTTTEHITLLNKESALQNRETKVHLKVDTGMGRIGCSPEEAKELAESITKSSNLKLNGLCTHLSTSDSHDQDFTDLQVKIFENVIRELHEKGIDPPLIHAANSGAILNNKAVFNMVRPGIILYGYPPSAHFEKTSDLKPVLELETRIVDLKRVKAGTSISYGRTYISKKDEYIATLPIGYGDGFFRALSNIGEVSINDKLYPIVGTICMDQLMVKVDQSVQLYDRVILIGRKKEEPNASSIASKIGTICYEVLTNIHRVKKYYINS